MCRHLKFNKPTRSFALEGHVIKIHSIGLHESCKNLCTMDNRCVSFNTGPSAKPDNMVCELSDSDAKRHPEDLKSRMGFFYRDAEVRDRTLFAEIKTRNSHMLHRNIKPENFYALS